MDCCYKQKLRYIVCYENYEVDGDHLVRGSDPAMRRLNNKVTDI